MAKTGKLHLVGTKFSKMTASNFGSNSLCGPSTVFQGTLPNQGAGPQDPPKKLQFVAQAWPFENPKFAIWKPKLAIWKQTMIILKPKVAICKLTFGIWKPKAGHLEALKRCCLHRKELQNDHYK